MNKKHLKKEIAEFQGTELTQEYSNLDFTIVLIRPEHAANIGSIARIMKNFNFNNLVVFNPVENAEIIQSHHTQGFAMHGKDILLNAQIIELDNQNTHLNKYKELMQQFDLVIASTAKGMHYKNVRRLSIFPKDLQFPISDSPVKIAIVFGKESRGLTNEEIELADMLIRIPSSDEYPTLNLSHACGIILYEIYNKIHKLSLGRGPKPVMLASRSDKQILYKMIRDIVNSLKIRAYTAENVLFAFKNVFERAVVSKKELNLILGVFSKLNSLLKKRKIYND
ncbi:MAG: TrmJ/YjtD family RNA methyltransferase [Candidatus Lokiarchaeota archaeon]|nr:TrmJ/YjtD family RNA methyltransferase [Candidatus Lokiarchaeota archaeon]